MKQNVKARYILTQLLFKIWLSPIVNPIEYGITDICMLDSKYSKKVVLVINILKKVLIGEKQSELNRFQTFINNVMDQNSEFADAFFKKLIDVNTDAQNSDQIFDINSYCLSLESIRLLLEISKGIVDHPSEETKDINTNLLKKIIERIGNDPKKDSLFEPTVFPSDTTLPQKELLSATKYILIIKIELQKKIETPPLSYTPLENNFFQFLTLIDLSGLPESISDKNFLEFIRNVQKVPSFMANNEANISTIEVLSSIILNDLKNIEAVHNFMQQIVSKKEEILKSVETQLAIHQGIQNKMLVLLSKVSKTNDRMEQKLNLLQKTTSAKLSAQRIIRGMNFPFEIRCFQQFSCEGPSIRFELALYNKKDNIGEKNTESSIGRFILLIKKLKLYFRKLVSNNTDEYGYYINEAA